MQQALASTNGIDSLHVFCITCAHLCTRGFTRKAQQCLVWWNDWLPPVAVQAIAAQGCVDCAAAPQVHYGLFSGSSMFDVSEAKDKCCG